MLLTFKNLPSAKTLRDYILLKRIQGVLIQRLHAQIFKKHLFIYLRKMEGEGQKGRESLNQIPFRIQ